MQVNVKKFLENAGVTEAFYPGKKIIVPCHQAGDFKSHCVVLDWRNPERIRMEVKAGLTGKDLEPKKLKKYPVSFQLPTYVEIEVLNDNEEREDEDEDGTSGKSGGGGKGFKKKSGLDSLRLMSEAFGSAIEGKVPELGKIVEMVVMGSKVAADMMGNVLDTMAHQIKHAKILTSELLVQAGRSLTKVKPPAFMAPRGDEQVDYKYNREKNADIGYRPGMG